MNILKSLFAGAFAVSVCIAQDSTTSITVKDADGNVYHTIKIGNQVWTVENLRTTKYNDVAPIPYVTDSREWSQLTTPGYCYYKNTTDTALIKKYGALYNWYAVDTKKLAPQGWHVPTDAEWDILVEYLIAHGYNWDRTTRGNKVAKSLAAKTDWRTDTVSGTIGNDLTKNNKSGFSALPGGSRYDNGDFYDIGLYGTWWSATENGASVAWVRRLHYDGDQLYGDLYGNKSCGFSVRLLRD